VRCLLLRGAKAGGGGGRVVYYYVIYSIDPLNSCM